MENGILAAINVITPELIGDAVAAIVLVVISIHLVFKGPDIVRRVLTKV